MKKIKFLALTLAFAIMLVGFRIPVYAQETTDEVLDVYMDTSKYDEINQELEEYGKTIRETNQNSGIYCFVD